MVSWHTQISSAWAARPYSSLLSSAPRSNRVSMRYPSARSSGSSGLPSARMASPASARRSQNSRHAGPSTTFWVISSIGPSSLDLADFAEPTDEELQAVVEAHRVIAQSLRRQVRGRPRRALRVGRRLGDRHQGRAERRDERFGVRAIVDVLDAMLHAGDRTGPVAAGGGADLVLGATHEPVALAGDPAIRS